MIKTTNIEHMRISVTNYCNLRCKHCYASNFTTTDFEKSEKEQLTIEQINSTIDTLCDNFDLKKVSITGGECLSKKAWDRTKAVLEHCLSKDLEVLLCSSGSGDIDVSQVVDVAGNKIDKLTYYLSLDGINKDTVDKFRGVKGAFDRVLKTVKEALAAGSKVQLRYTLSNDNYDEVLSCYEFANNLGAHSFIVKPMYYAGNATNNEDLYLTREKVKHMQEELVKMSVNNKTRIELPCPVFIEHKDLPSGANALIIPCTCGWGSGYITTNGDVYPCTYLIGAPNKNDFILGNIKNPEFDFVESWKNKSTYKDFRQPDEYICTTYELLSKNISMVLK